MVGSRRWRLRTIAGTSFVFGFLLFYMAVTAPGRQFGAEMVRITRFMNEERGAAVVAKKGSFDWSKVKFQHLPPTTLIKLPQGGSKRLPPVQYSFDKESASFYHTRQTRREEVRRVFVQDWANYRKLAWKADALDPMSGRPKDQFAGWAATLVDSLDTLWIMGLREEFDDAVTAVAEIDFGEASSSKVNMFETTIRYLGGLLGAYDLSKREALLTKAIELGDMLYSGFNTKSNMPVDFVLFENAKTGQELNIERWVVSASPGSLCLEMTRLSQITGDPKYYDVVARVMQTFEKHQNTTKLPGLWPMWVSMKELDLDGRNEFTLAGNADSLYEYLPKMYALLGGLEPMYKSMTEAYVAAADKYMFFRPMVPGQEDILISGNVEVGSDGSTPLDPESEHLACFIGGSVALAGKLLGDKSYVETGDKLARGCAYVYHSFASGVMPERYNMVPCEPKRATSCPWDEERWLAERERRPEWKKHLPQGFTTAKDPRYLLRPEAIESVFLLYRMTGNKAYQDIAWHMFKSVETASQGKYGHAAILDVTVVGDEEFREENLEDYQESFWYAETLKYYYLMFSPPDLINLDEYVLNTEAHPLRRPIV